MALWIRGAAVVLMSGGLALAPAHAGLYTVTKTADTADGRCDADCSLREAVQAANAAAGADVIRLPHRYYKLTRAPEADDDNAVAGDLDLDGELVMRGLAEGSTIDATFIDRVVEVLPGASVELIDLAIKNGRVGSRGAGLLNQGTLVLRRVAVVYNRVYADFTGVAEGAGIFNFGVLRVIASRIDRNVVEPGPADRRAGAGIFNSAGAQLYLYDTLVRANVNGSDDEVGLGAGLFNWGAARIDRSYFYANDPGDGEGSAMANREGASLSVFNTTISGNGHDGARGAIANGSEQQGETEAQSKLNLLNVTIANNNGGGLFNTGRARIRNTIVAGNYTQDGNDRYYESGRNCETLAPGTLTQSYSLIGADGNCQAYLYVDNRTVFDGVLGYLRYLGGPSPVHPLPPGSPAIDAGDPEVCPAFDQRRGRRPADGDGNGTEICDIGAMEVGADE